MPRYEQQEEAKLTPEQRRIWDECKAGPRGSVPPPVHVWLKSPGLADHAHKLGAYVRFGTQYTPKQTEIAILVTARYWTAQFEWAAHVRLGLHAGLSQEQIDAIAERRTPEFDDPGDRLIYRGVAPPVRRRAASPSRRHRQTGLDQQRRFSPRCVDRTSLARRDVARPIPLGGAGCPGEISAFLVVFRS